MAELSDPVADFLYGPAEVSLIAAVWMKGDVIEGANQNVERMDMAGNRIRYTHYVTAQV